VVTLPWSILASSSSLFLFTKVHSKKFDDWKHQSDDQSGKSVALRSLLSVLAVFYLTNYLQVDWTPWKGDLNSSPLFQQSVMKFRGIVIIYDMTVRQSVTSMYNFLPEICSTTVLTIDQFWLYNNRRTWRLQKSKIWAGPKVLAIAHRTLWMGNKLSSILNCTIFLYIIPKYFYT
jgi:hypothetical protein